MVDKNDHHASPLHLLSNKVHSPYRTALHPCASRARGIRAIRANTHDGIGEKHPLASGNSCTSPVAAFARQHAREGVVTIRRWRYRAAGHCTTPRRLIL